MRCVLIVLVLLIASSVGGMAAAVPGGVVASGDWGALWTCAGTCKVMRETKPPSGKVTAVRVSAARNEYEPFQLVLRPARQLKNVKVTPHTLGGSLGAKIDAWNITCRNVEYVRVSEPTTADVPAGMYPDPLPEFRPFAAAKGENSPVWVTVYVPPKTPAGTYRGTIDVTADGMKKIAVPLEVRVWDFDLPTVSKLRTAYHVNYDLISQYQAPGDISQRRRLVELYNIEFWRHRVAPFKPYAYYEIKTTLENDQISVNFSDFDLAIQKFFPMFNSFLLPDFVMVDTMDFDPEKRDELTKIDYMRAVAEHLVDKGQLAKGYNYLMDEPSEEQYGKVVEAAKLSRLADPRIKVLVTEQVEPKLVESVDIWVPAMDAYDEKASKERQAKGEEIWWYVGSELRHPYPNYFIDYAAIEPRILPWITWRYGVNGILYRQTTDWRENPYEVAMSHTPVNREKLGNGDGRLLYPPVRKPSEKFVEKGPVPSIRWEMIREGIEDYDCFRILQDRIDKGGSPGAVSKGKAALKLVESCVVSRTEFTQDPVKLERVRAKVAEAIEGLR